MKYQLKLNRHDFIISLCSIIFVTILIVISIFALPNSNGDDAAVVRYNNEIVKIMPLNVDDEFIMRKSDGYRDLYGDELVVTVKNNKVSITKEDSPFNYCSYLGEISQRGSSLICAPNCVRVTIESMNGGNVDDGVDLIK